VDGSDRGHRAPPHRRDGVPDGARGRVHRLRHGIRCADARPGRRLHRGDGVAGRDLPAGDGARCHPVRRAEPGARSARPAVGAHRRAGAPAGSPRSGDGGDGSGDRPGLRRRPGLARPARPVRPRLRRPRPHPVPPAGHRAAQPGARRQPADDRAPSVRRGAARTGGVLPAAARQDRHRRDARTPRPPRPAARATRWCESATCRPASATTSTCRRWHTCAGSG